MTQGPLIVRPVAEQLDRARDTGVQAITVSLDLQRSTSPVQIAAAHWEWQGQRYPYLEKCKDRTIYAWNGAAFEPLARYTHALIKLVPTSWGPPTFEIDGIKMLPSEHLSPYEDAQRKVALIGPRNKDILDTCGGLGYFAAWCLQGGARRVLSFEKNPDVLWLRSLNPWSPGENDPRLELLRGDVTEEIVALAAESFDAILHDPPRFGIAGELYSQSFYDQLARVLRPRGTLFHYTGSPNKLTSQRDVPAEVARRLQRAGFRTWAEGDGVLAVKTARPGGRQLRDAMTR